MHAPTNTPSRRWAACRDFSWLCGMSTDRGEVIIGFDPNGLTRVADKSGEVYILTDADLADRTPDLWDDATEGVLYAALAAQRQGLCVRRDAAGLWTVTAWMGGTERPMSSAPSRIEALVGAWEAL